MVAGAYMRVGDVVGILFGLAVLGWLSWHAWQWRREKKLPAVTRVTVQEVAGRRDSWAVYDVRSHGYYEKGSMRIKDSTRLDPNSVTRADLKFPEGRQIVLYCTCYREATAERVARYLLDRGIEAAVLSGSYQAWKKAGLPVEPRARYRGAAHVYVISSGRCRRTRFANLRIQPAPDPRLFRSVKMRNRWTPISNANCSATST